MVTTPRPLEGRVCLVTGATSGIGRVAAFELARQGARLILPVRDMAKGQALAEAIARETGHAAVEVERADMARLADVRALAATVTARHPALHLLVNNAGGVLPERVVTDEGYEAVFVTNFLAPFLLARLLEAPLIAGAPSRIVNVASDAHRIGRLDFDDLQSEKRYTGLKAYAQAKLALVVATYEHARRLADTGVTVNALHPGVVATGFGAQSRGVAGLVLKLARPFMISPEAGARTLLHVATAPEFATATGQYVEKCRVARSSEASLDPALAARLWETAERLVAGPASKDLHTSVGS
jgi:NAD(P)-dependent dehydrogenase (short-subunit alcohol dehydrogenase family)